MVSTSAPGLNHRQSTYWVTCLDLKGTNNPEDRPKNCVANVKASACTKQGKCDSSKKPPAVQDGAPSLGPRLLLCATLALLWCSWDWCTAKGGRWGVPAGPDRESADLHVVYPVPVVWCTMCPAVLGGRCRRAVYSQDTEFTNCVQKCINQNQKPLGPLPGEHCGVQPLA